MVQVFISHSWSYTEHYRKLSEWVFETPWSVSGRQIHFSNNSVPKDDPIHNAPNASALQRAIYSIIASSDVIVIPTGMYANYSKWIQTEIDGAQHYRKPILAVNPWAQERKSSVVLDAATEFCGWNKQSVINAVWRLGS